MLFSLFWLLWPILVASGAMGFGTAISTNDVFLMNIVSVMAGCLLPLRGIWYIILAKRSGAPLRARMFIQTTFELSFVPIIILLPRFSYNTYLFFLCLYFSFYAAVQGINAVIYFRNRVFQYFIPAASQSILFLAIFLGIFILPPELKQRLVTSGSGFLLSLLGHSYLYDFLSVLIKNRRAAEIFRKISITMPGFSGISIPYRLLSIIKSEKSDIESQAEVIFSFGAGGKDIAGHCELCVDGKTYTYGNYDPDSRAILKTMGNGIIFRAERDKYIDFLLSRGRTVAIYGLNFDDEQFSAFKNNIDAFNDILVRWDDAEKTPENEYIHRVLDDLNAEVYKINEGRFKTYFLPTINCVTLTGGLLRGTNAGNTILPGLYTPGSYMDALHRLYLARNDVVVSVKVYDKYSFK